MKVWILHGWFGEHEWIEGVYATQELAEAESVRLWETRSSDKGPEYCRGLHKFGPEEYEVVEG